MDSRASTLAIEEPPVCDAWDDATDQETWKRARLFWGRYDDEDAPSSRWLASAMLWRQSRTPQGRDLSLPRNWWVPDESEEARKVHLPETWYSVLLQSETRASGTTETARPSFYSRSVRVIQGDTRVSEPSPFLLMAMDPLQYQTFHTESVADWAGSTRQVPPVNGCRRDVAHMFDVLLCIGTHEEVESEFARVVGEVVLRYGDCGISEITHRIESGQVDPQIAEYVLRALGDTDHVETHQSRLWALKRALRSSSSAVRDGANVGLAFMDDPRALPALREAVEE